MTIQRVLCVIMVVGISAAMSLQAVAVLKLKNKTIRPIDVALMLGEYIYDQVRVDAISPAVLKVPGIPGTFTVQFTRSGLMGNTIQVPVVAGTELLFDENTFSIVQPKG